MRKTILTACLTAVFVLAPASWATTSIAKAKQICKTAAQAHESAPEGVSLKSRGILTSENKVVIRVLLKYEQRESVEYLCEVDRATSTATLIVSE